VAPQKKPAALRVSADGSFSLPAEAVTDALAVVGRRGSGKTFAASVLAEEMLDIGAQIVVIDPTGVWWGLTSSADGRAAGYEIVVIGGNEADVPLEPTGGELVADVIVDEKISAVLDLSLLRKADRTRFLTSFAERLYHRKGPARHRTPLHLFVDEAHAFVPQRPQRGQERMLGAGEDLVQMGRSRGIGVTLISQRPAVLNKNVLSQCSGLVAMQLTAPQDRKALDDWLAEVADQDLRRELVAALPTLAVGEAVVWVPHLEVFERTVIRARRTYDSSSTPTAGQDPVLPATRADIDLGRLAAAMAATIERAAETDPAKLRARTRAAELQVAELQARLEAPRPTSSQAAVEKRGGELALELDEARRRIADLEETNADLEAAVSTITEAHTAARAAVTSLEAAASTITNAAAAISASAHTAAGHLDPLTPRRQPPAPTRRPLPPHPNANPRTGQRPNPAPPPDEPPAGTVNLKAGARRMLETLARYHPGTMTRSQVATAAGMKKTGGTFAAYWSTLRTNNLIVEDGNRDGGQVTITAAGFAAIGATPDLTPLTHAEIVAMWDERLKAGARRMLAELTAIYPNSLTRADLAARVDMTPTGGTFSAYLSALKTNNLAVVDGDIVAASPDLYP